MNDKYISYYFRHLCVETFPSYGTDVYYDMCIYDHFFEILLRLTTSQKDFNVLIFVDKYLNKLENDKYIQKFVDLSKIDYESAKNDFLKLLSNIYQITLIYNYRNDLSRLEEELSGFDGNRIERYRSFGNLGETTINLIDNALQKVQGALLSKINFEYDMQTYDSVLKQTLNTVYDKLENVKIEDIVSENSEEPDGYRQKVFKKSKKDVLDSFGNFIAVIQDTFNNNRKIRQLKSVDYYLSFLLHDEVISIEGSKRVFRNFYSALYYAYRMHIYFLYFKDMYEKATLKEILAYFNDDLFKVGTGEDYVDRRLENIFFNIVNRLEVRKDFKHLPLIILGYHLSLDAKTIEKISVQLDNSDYKDNDIEDIDYANKNANKTKQKTKNPNVISRLKDLKYSTNVQTVYDLDEDIGELLDMFNSYKIETVYEANVVDEDGELETMSFDSEEDYKNYIRSDCAENQLDYMVENFLSKRDKKVYYDPLFKLTF